MRTVLKNFHICDEAADTEADVIIDDGFISAVLPDKSSSSIKDAAAIIDGDHFLPSKELPVLMPAFIDLHAHFRDPGFPAKENLESASLAAAAGGFGTVVCMANTNPVIDTVEKAAALKSRSDMCGLIDLYPVLSLSKGMEGRELSEIGSINAAGRYLPLMLSEDGKDLADDALFLAAMKEAKRIGIPVSCHCDYGGENNAVGRAIELGKKAGCHIHIAHVSTKEAVEMIRRAKAAAKAAAKAGTDPSTGGFTLSCEATPHHLCLNEQDAARLGEGSHGRVNPPLRSEEDRKALIRAVADGTIDAIATDHAPHSEADKEAGSPGFSGFETAFSAVFTELVRRELISLKRLSALMTANPAKLLNLHKLQKQGRIAVGYRADLTIVNMAEPWTVDPSLFKSRGSNSPFKGQQLYGKILMTFHSGRMAFGR